MILEICERFERRDCLDLTGAISKRRTIVEPDADAPFVTPIRVFDYTKPALSKERQIQNSYSRSDRSVSRPVLNHVGFLVFRARLISLTRLKSWFLGPHHSGSLGSFTVTSSDGQ